VSVRFVISTCSGWRRGSWLLLLTCVASCSVVRSTVGGSDESPPSSPARAEIAPRNGLEVIGAIRRAHPSRALRSLAFTVMTADPDAPARVTRARTLATLPGRFRTTTLPASRRTGTVRNQQRVAIFERGRRVVSRTRVDLATLLAYDLFAQGIDSTIKSLDAAGVRYGVSRRDRLDGRRVWVVGADENDTKSPQFWVDAEEWRLVRVIQRDLRAPNVIVDVRFSEFTDVMGVPLATRIDVFRNGEWTERQTLTDVAVNPAVPTRAFDVARWRDVSADN
jgi:hypothetical protein